MHTRPVAGAAAWWSCICTTQPPPHAILHAGRRLALSLSTRRQLRFDKSAHSGTQSVAKFSAALLCRVGHGPARASASKCWQAHMTREHANAHARQLHVPAARAQSDERIAPQSSNSKFDDPTVLVRRRQWRRRRCTHPYPNHSATSATAYHAWY